MRLYAFQGLRYRLPAEAIDELAAPPYDQIDDRLRDDLHARSPHQFTQLTVPAPGLAGDPYQESTRLHANWLASGLVERDERPAIYPYTIHLADGGRRLGVCGMIGVEPESSGVIRPHEATLDKPLADRVALLKANRVDLEPILFLSDDRGRLDQLIEEDTLNGSPVAIHTDPDGHRHELFRVDDPARIQLYRDLLGPLPAAIADGHHRYKTARRFAEENQPDAGTAASAKMTVVTSLASPGLTIDPIHRGLGAPLDPTALSDLVVERRAVTAADGGDFARQVARAAQPALGVWNRGADPEIWSLAPEAAPDTLSQGARELTVALLHGALLPALGYAPENATDGTVTYRSDPGTLWNEVRDGGLEVGLFLPPMTPASFAAAIANGDLLPPKATRFLPKVVSGLVWADHTSTLG